MHLNPTHAAIQDEKSEETKTEGDGDVEMKTDDPASPVEGEDAVKEEEEGAPAPVKGNDTMPLLVHLPVR